MHIEDAHPAVNRKGDYRTRRKIVMFGVVPEKMREIESRKWSYLPSRTIDRDDMDRQRPVTKPNEVREF